MSDIETLVTQLQERFAEKLQNIAVAVGEITIEISSKHLRDICFVLRDDEKFRFEMLIDVCGVDYLDYGFSEWTTNKATLTGFERGVDRNRDDRIIPWNKPRFGVVYHFLSVAHNHRLRLRTYAEGEPPLVKSITDIWAAANWYEREAFDLYGIVFDGHPDLRRILTDYGFIGHPFRKDFPLIGNVEMRYDATQKRVIYEPVSIPPRTLVPKVIRREKNIPTENSNG